MIKLHLEFIGRRGSLRAAKRKDITIVVDVLRSSSTIITALANGAKGVIPVKTLREARQLFKEHSGSLLAGEENMIRPHGFHMGNSPSEFTSDKVKGRLIVLVTTDGTKAIRLASMGARAVLVGALLNASSVAQAGYNLALKMNANITLVAAGRKGKFALEDSLGAGLIIGRFPRRMIDSADDQALWAWYSMRQAEKNLRGIINQSEHAKRLKSSGFSKDVEFCSKVDVSNIVPVLKNSTLIPLSREHANNLW